MPKTSLGLTGQWEFKEYPLSTRRMRDLDSSHWHQTTVPCSIFNSLIETSQIEQDDINANPEKFHWVSEKPWVYRKTFDAPESLLACDRVDLEFEGLDTLASIWFNGKLLGRTSNMFIPFRFDVTELLKPENNSLLVKFDPAAHHAKRLMDRYASFKDSDFINPHRVYIRKAQYQFGWDFCPPLPGCGIWRPVRLEGIKKARLNSLHIRTVDCNHHHADIKIEAALDNISNEDFICRLSLSCNTQQIEQTLNFAPRQISQSTLIRIKNPFLWSPAGYGRQHLYHLEAKLLSGDEVIDQMQKKIGIRTVKLDRSPDDYGEKFQFQVNGQPIFAKGANWIPLSIFAGSATSNDYEKLLLAAANANINMLRVWGGGYYETDEFYRLCDQLGIMVWQDFMFACAYYPDRQWFFKEVEEEAAEIIKRLRNHPSLALWCGNNEIDQMHSDGKLGKGKKFYGKEIYHRLLPRLVAELDPDTDYIPTTPLAKKDKFKTSLPLTTHQWDVWSGHHPVRDYQCPPADTPQFVTEFGLQSLPEMETVKSFCPSDRLRIGSYPLEKHNYQLDGNSRLYRYMGDLFGTAKDLEEFIYLSQVTQARAARTYVEYLRANNERNNGVLFWQFNDCCPALSWSAVDYAKEPKALYYYAKRFFSKHLITAIPSFKKTDPNLPPLLESMSVTAINDSDQPLTATLSCRLIDLFGAQLDNVTCPVMVSPFSKSTPLKLPKAITSPSLPEKSCLHLLLEKDGKKIAENLFFYLPDKYIDWPKPKINSQLRQITDRQWKLKLAPNTVIRDLQIHPDRDGMSLKISDNFIDLLPFNETEVTIVCEHQLVSLESSLQLYTFGSVLRIN